MPNGFSTLELLIALALMSVILVTAVEAVAFAQYWQITALTASEAIIKNTNIANSLIKMSTKDFRSVSTTMPLISQNISDPVDASCLAGGFCYETQNIVTDISSCAKNTKVSVRYKIAARYATSTIDSDIYVRNLAEVAAVGGDCLVMLPDGNWATGNIQNTSTATQPPLGTTGIDIVDNKMYTVSTQSPYLRIFSLNTDPHIPPVLLGSSTASNVRLNDIDVIRDIPTGRLYAYVTQHSTSSQLAVYDVTNSSEPQLLVQLPLFAVASDGSFPQGWRVVAYGGELYVVSRETTGPELHIFSLLNPNQPIEKTSAVINLNRTVNDMTVRDEVIGSTTRRFLYLAASSDLKEVGVYDVTGSVPIEIAAINLTGTADASSLHLVGNTLYVGRKNSTAPELYAFAADKLIQNILQVVGTSELGTEVLALSSNGAILIVGTTKNGEELQIWNKDVSTWSNSVANAGRLSYLANPRLAPLGFDVDAQNLYLASQSQTQPETITTIYSP